MLLERWKRVWEATEAAGYEALVVAGRGIVTQYGSLLYVLGYAPVIRTGYAVIAPGSPPIGVLPRSPTCCWPARRECGTRASGARAT